MKMLIINLSDIHFIEGNNPISDRIEKVFDAVKNIEVDIEKVLILISGDVAFSGKKNEYFEATLFLDLLASKLQSYLNVEIIVIASPGNHDCYFEDGDNKIRKILIGDIYKNEDANIDSNVIEFCCSTQKNFFDFRNSLPSYRLLSFDSKITYQYRIPLSDGFEIKVNCYNTSWLSQIREEQGKLFFPLSYLPSQSDFNRSDLTISLLHHPYNWYSEANARKIKEILERASDIIITGHEHIKDQYFKIGPDSNFTSYLESDLLQGEDFKYSGFNVALIDLKTHQQKFLNLRWTDNKYEPTELADWFEYKRYERLVKSKFQINEKFQNYLSDIGLNLTHPHVSKPTLDDLYVYPTIMNLNFETSTGNSMKDYKSAEYIITQLNKSSTKIFLVGADGCGKTAFCKTIFNRTDKNLIPILMDGKDIDSAAINDHYCPVKIGSLIYNKLVINTLQRLNF